MNIFKRIAVFIKRRSNAYKLGVSFTYSNKWVMPSTVIINYKTLELSLKDPEELQWVFIDVLLDDSYGLKYFKSKLKQVNNILDIGANQGLFILAAKNVFPEARIHSYEPNQSLTDYLAHQSNFAGSSVYMEAVGLIKGRVNLGNLESNNSLVTQTNLADDGSIVQTAFKDCIERIGGSVDLLKLDCEGAEWEILKDIGALKKVCAITLEYHTDETHDHNSILAALTTANFKIVNYCVTGATWGTAWAVNKLHS